MKTAKMTTAEKIRNLQMVKVTGNLPPEIEAEYLNSNKGTTFNSEGRKVNVTIPAREEDVRDDENPDFLFSTTFTSLLVKIAKGQVDAEFYARKELANRGLDLNGNWVGFEAAAKEHKI